MHPGELLGKYDPFPAPCYEELKGIPALDDHVWYGKKRTQYGRAFLFPLDEHPLQAPLAHLEFLGQCICNKIEKILLFHGPVDI